MNFRWKTHDGRSEFYAAYHVSCVISWLNWLFENTSSRFHRRRVHFIWALCYSIIEPYKSVRGIFSSIFFAFFLWKVDHRINFPIFRLFGTENYGSYCHSFHIFYCYYVWLMLTISKTRCTGCLYDEQFLSLQRITWP